MKNDTPFVHSQLESSWLEKSVCPECHEKFDVCGRTATNEEIAERAKDHNIVITRICTRCGLVTLDHGEPMSDEDFAEFSDGLHPRDRFVQEMLGITLHNRIPESQENS